MKTKILDSQIYVLKSQVYTPFDEAMDSYIKFLNLVRDSYGDNTQVPTFAEWLLLPF